MAARPGDWSLLTDDGNDPVAGDPDAVRTQATYYGTMAETIIKEAHRLKTLGADDELIGKYAKSLKTELSDLADEVHKAHKRYDGVHKALKPYATALDTAKTKSLSALKDAEAANTAQTKANASPNPQAKPGGKPLTDAQKTQAKSHGTAVTAANNDLSAAKTKLSNALNDLNSAGKTAAGIINDHNDDSLKDHHHWWDAVVKFLKIVVEICNYAILVLAIASLLIPGLDVLGAMYVFAYVALAADLVLLATGNGSLLDVGLDVLGIMTLGLGSAAVKGGEQFGKEGAEFATKYAARNYKEFASLAEHEMPTLTGSAKSFAVEVAEQGKNANTYLKSVANMGEKNLAEARSSVDALCKAFPRSTKLLAYQNELNRLAKINRIAVTGGTVPVAVNTGLSSSNSDVVNNIKPHSDAYDRGKENSNILKFLPTHVDDVDLDNASHHGAR